MTSLEGWGSTIELHPRLRDDLGGKPSDSITESGRQDSNLRSSAPKADALATTLRPGRPARPNVRDECRAHRSEDQSTCSCICGLVRRGAAPNGRFELHLWPCAETRATCGQKRPTVSRIEVTLHPWYRPHGGLAALSSPRRIAAAQREPARAVPPSVRAPQIIRSNQRAQHRRAVEPNSGQDHR
jgi:hypothetical protein